FANENVYKNIGPYKWPYCELPYVIADDIKNAADQKKILVREAIMAAIDEMNKLPLVVKVVKKENAKQHVHYVKFVYNEKGSWSKVGCCGGEQKIRIAPWESYAGEGRDISPGTVLHEIMHALGFEHEHQRPDRDKLFRLVDASTLEDIPDIDIDY